jgi:hypothetical protein
MVDFSSSYTQQTTPALPPVAGKGGVVILAPHTEALDQISKTTGAISDQMGADLGQAAGAKAQSDSTYDQPANSSLLNKVFDGLTPYGRGYDKGVEQTAATQADVAFLDASEKAKRDNPTNPQAYAQAMDAATKDLTQNVDGKLYSTYVQRANAIKAQGVAEIDQAQTQFLRQQSAAGALSTVDKLRGDLVTGIASGTLSHDVATEKSAQAVALIDAEIQKRNISPLQGQRIKDQIGFDISSTEALNAVRANPSKGMIDALTKGNEKGPNGQPFSWSPEQREEVVNKATRLYNQALHEAAVGAAAQHANDVTSLNNEIASLESGLGPQTSTDPKTGITSNVVTPQMIARLGKGDPNRINAIVAQLDRSQQIGNVRDILKTSSITDDSVLDGLAAGFTPRPNTPDIAGQVRDQAQMQAEINKVKAQRAATAKFTAEGLRTRWEDNLESLRSGKGPIMVQDETGESVPLFTSNTIAQMHPEGTPGREAKIASDLQEYNNASIKGGFNVDGGLTTREEDQARAGALAANQSPFGVKDSVSTQNVLQEEIKKKWIAIDKDPAGEVIKRDPTGSIAQLITSKDPAVREQGYATMDSMFDHLGIPQGQRKYLPADSAEKLGASLDGLSPVQFDQALDQIKAQFGTRADAVIKQLATQEKFKLSDRKYAITTIPDGANRRLVTQALEPTDKDRETVLAASPGGASFTKVKIEQALQSNDDYQSFRASLAAQGGVKQAATAQDLIINTAQYLAATNQGEGDPLGRAVKAVIGHFDVTNSSRVVARIDKSDATNPTADELANYSYARMNALRPEDIVPGPRQPGEIKTDDERKADIYRSFVSNGRIINGPNGTVQGVLSNGQVLMIRNTPETGGTPDVAGKYETKLTPQQEIDYQAWLKNNNLNETNDYDYRGAYLAGEGPASNGHFTDRYKKPNHATFSDESIYSGKDGNVGGHWVNNGTEKNPKWSFMPGITNIENGLDNTRTDLANNDPEVTLVEPNASALGVAAAHIAVKNRAKMQPYAVPFRFPMQDAKGYTGPVAPADQINPGFAATGGLQ